jgi:hypothetical protein
LQEEVSQKTMFTRKAPLFVAALLFAGQASAGVSYSLDSLLSGGSLNSADGKLVFSDFAYTQFNGPSAGNIQVSAVDSGLSFGTPFVALDTTIDFNIEYKVTGVDVLINGVSMKSTGSGSGTGVAGIFKVAEGSESAVNLANIFSSQVTNSSASSSFSAESSVLVRDDIFGIPGENGIAGVSDFTQTFSTTGTEVNPIPSPTAALAGVALLGVIGMRRRRSA